MDQLPAPDVSRERVVWCGPDMNTLPLGATWRKGYSGRLRFAPTSERQPSGCHTSGMLGVPLPVPDTVRTSPFARVQAEGYQRPELIEAARLQLPFAPAV